MVNERSACPQCRANGGDNSGNNLVTFSNGTKHCFSCGYHEGSAIEHEANVNAASLYLPPTAQVLGVSYDTAAFFGVTSDGMLTYFHYFDVTTNKCIGIKTRNYVAESCGAAKHETIRYAGSTGLYGVNTLQHTPTLVLVEGESDTLFTWQALDGTTDVLGLPGASTAQYVNDYETLFNSYERIVVLTDNDSAGNKLRENLYKLLPEWLVYAAHYPKHAKDARDCTSSELIECVNNAELRPTETRVVTGKSGFDAALQRNSVNTRLVFNVSQVSPGLNRLLGGGIHAGDFIGLLGNSGQGKSTFMYQLAACAVYNSVNTLFVTNEASSDYASSRLAHFCSTDMLGAYCTVIETHNFDALMALLNKYAVDVVFIDVLNSIAPNFIDPVLTAAYMQTLLTYANNSGVGILANMHTTANNEQFKPMPLRLADAAGGRAVQRALNGVIGFTSGLQHLHETSRLLTLSKPLRNREVENKENAIIHYDSKSRTYFEYGGHNAKTN